MSSEPKRHHYIPESYQRKFADEDEKLWMYNRHTQIYRKVNPVNICCEKDLYTVDPRGQKHRLIESRFLALVDGEGATAIRKFEK